jgi:hypothetical protein
MYWSGMGSGSGASGRSHASVQSLRSMRHGLPVNDRDRIVSRLTAASNWSFWAGGSPDSST